MVEPMTRARGHVLAIDLGTSGPKVAIATTRGEVLGVEARSTKLDLGARAPHSGAPTPDHAGAASERGAARPGDALPGKAEQDPLDWWSAIVEAAQALHARQLVDPARIEAVCVTAQWAGTVAVDEQGTPLHPAIIWMDTRGARYVPQFAGGWPSVAGYGAVRLARWIRKTGGVPSLAGKEPLAHIAYLRHHAPEVLARAYKLLEPKDWLNHRLTGRFAGGTDSMALHWVSDHRDLARIHYDPALLAMARLEARWLPELKRPVDLLGPVTERSAHELGIPADAVVVMGTPDVQSASLGSGAVRPFEGHIYFGTSSWVSCHVPFKKTDLAGGVASLPSALPDRYFVATSQETAGQCLQWLRELLKVTRPTGGSANGGALGSGSAGPGSVGDVGAVLDADAGQGALDAEARAFFARLDERVSSVAPGADGVMFTPWLFGERTPVADPHLRASFVHLSLSTRQEHLLRAVLEGVAFNTKWLLGSVERFVGRPMPTLRFIGGGARSAVWAQILADVLDRDIARVDDPVGVNARGAACLAGIALGHLSVDEVPDAIRVTDTFHPNPLHRRRYDDMYRVYLDLFRALRPLHARLGRSDLGAGA
jgi:xylulokinase